MDIIGAHSKATTLAVAGAMGIHGEMWFFGLSLWNCCLETHTQPPYSTLPVLVTTPGRQQQLLDKNVRNFAKSQNIPFFRFIFFFLPQKYLCFTLSPLNNSVWVRLFSGKGGQVRSWLSMIPWLKSKANKGRKRGNVLVRATQIKKHRSRKAVRQNPGRHLWLGPYGEEEQ